MTVMEPVISFLSTWSYKKVSLDQVLQGADRPRKPVLRVMDRLTREGHLEEIEDNRINPIYGEVGPPRRNPTWMIIEKPVYTNPKSPSRYTIRDKVWKAIRMTRFFTRQDIARITEANEGSVADTLKLLEVDGYIRRTGKDGRRITYMLVKDVGPKRPIIGEQRKKERKNAQ